MPLFLGEDKISRVVTTIEAADGGINTNDATLTSGSQMLSGVTSYSNGKKYTGTIPTVTAPTPTVSVSASGTITASVENPYGYQPSNTTKTATTNLSTQDAKTITPNDSIQIAVNSGIYTTGAITVAAVPTETKSITANGTFSPTSGSYFSSVTVNVPSEGATLQEKTVTPSEATQTISPDAGYDGLSTVTVNPISTTYVGSAVPTKGATAITPTSATQTAISSGTYATGNITVSPVPTETKSITANGTYTPTSGKWFSSVSVNVVGDSFNTQTKSVTPTESEQTVTPDEGYDGLSSVTVGAISSTYIGSGIAHKSATTYTPTEREQTISAGQYLDGPQIISAIPSTYVGNGITRKGATAIMPSTSSQVAVSSGTYVTGDIEVSAMPPGALGTPIVNESTGLVTVGVSRSGYLSTSATKTLELTTKSAATITPGTNDQTIAAGRYLTGNQIIKGDANLVPENIISGKSIFGVSGSVVIQKYYTGATEPSSSLGNDGDLYFKV